MSPWKKDPARRVTPAPTYRGGRKRKAPKASRPSLGDAILQAIPAFASRVTFGECFIFSTEPMRCPLCGVDIPPSTEHRCKRSSK